MRTYSANEKGVTLIETVIYAGVLVLIMAVVLGLLLWVVRSNTKGKAVREAADNMRAALHILGNEIREAESIYTPTTTSTQLSLETTKNVPTGDPVSYVDFFLCGTQLCLKRESENPFAITSERVVVSAIEFGEVATATSIPSVQVMLQVEYNNPDNKPELEASLTATSTFSIRSYE